MRATASRSNRQLRYYTPNSSLNYLTNDFEPSSRWVAPNNNNVSGYYSAGSSERTGPIANNMEYGVTVEWLNGDEVGSYVPIVCDQYSGHEARLMWFTKPQARVFR